jgi:K+-transporting ATPase A subunit
MAAAIAVFLAGLMVGRAPEYLGIHGNSGKLFLSDYGYPLWVVYAMWIVVLALLYPACLWFARLKRRRDDWWLSYL